MIGGVNIAIFGSCVSRDVFNFDEENKFNIIDCFARSSFASIYTSPSDIPVSVLESSFQNRQVQ